jgi:hypothetical protein
MIGHCWSRLSQRSYVQAVYTTTLTSSGSIDEYVNPVCGRKHSLFHYRACVCLQPTPGLPLSGATDKAADFVSLPPPTFCRGSILPGVISAESSIAVEMCASHPMDSWPGQLWLPTGHQACSCPQLCRPATAVCLRIKYIQTFATLCSRPSTPACPFRSQTRECWPRCLQRVQPSDDQL